MVEESWTNKKP